MSSWYGMILIYAVLAGHHHLITMKGGKRPRWLPLCLLAVFAALEFATQYLFIATNFAEIVGIPASALHFIEVRFKLSTKTSIWSYMILRSGAGATRTPASFSPCLKAPEL